MELRWPLRIVEERRDGVPVFVLAGRLSAESAPRLQAAIGSAADRGDVRLVIDLSAVDYISSAGLRVLEEAAGLCARGQGALALCGLVDAVRMAIDLSGMASRFLIEPSRDLAVGRVTMPPLTARRD